MRARFVLDAQDNLVVGTEPSGLILRVSQSGQGFVLYQAPKREITAVADGLNRRDLRRGRRQQDSDVRAAATRAIRRPLRCRSRRRRFRLPP